MSCGILNHMYDTLFFFFKQKTAYEMRISDWSSDVCSSDLSLSSECTELHDLNDVADRRRAVEALGGIPGQPLGLGSGLQVATGEVQPQCEIGRASCRERVCQYV